jgi:hypothetical protein
MRCRWLVVAIGLPLVGCLPPWATPGPASSAVRPAIARQEGFEEGVLLQRLQEGDLLVRRADGSQWVLSPMRNCSWCWLGERRRVYLRFGATSTTLVNEKGETAECWTGPAVGRP